MGKKNNKPNYSREANVSTKVTSDKVRTKVNGGVFIFPETVN